MAAVLWASLAPTAPAPGHDKAGHFFAYGVLMFWFAQLYARRAPWAAGFIALGVTLEFAQGGLGYRRFELYDMLANSAGVLLGWGAARLVGRRLFP